MKKLKDIKAWYVRRYNYTLHKNIFMQPFEKVERRKVLWSVSLNRGSLMIKGDENTEISNGLYWTIIDQLKEIMGLNYYK